MDQENLEQLVPLEEVQRVVLAACAPLDPIAVDPDSAFGLVLAEDVRAAEDLPSFANSAMDGYAVRSEDTAGARLWSCRSSESWLPGPHRSGLWSRERRSRS